MLGDPAEQGGGGGGGDAELQVHPSDIYMLVLHFIHARLLKISQQGDW